MNIFKIKRDRILLFGSMTVVALAHLPALANHLVADSWVFVVPHPFSEIFGYFFKSIIPPEWEALWLRPIPMFFFWLDTHIWPNTEWGPHLTNIIIHIFNVWLIWTCMRFIQYQSNQSHMKPAGGLPALTACLVYGLHPLMVGTVSWVAARFDVLCLTFGLGGMVMWLKWDAGVPGKRHGLWGMVLLLGCLLSKEQGVVFIATCFLVTLLRSVFSPKERPRSIRGLIFLSLMFCGYFLYRIIIFGGLGGYLTKPNGLSLLPPFYFLLAMVYPFHNVLKGWTLSWTVIAAIVFIIVLATIILEQPSRTNRRIQNAYKIYIVCAASLVVFGLATTIPNPGMTFTQIIGHAESRFVSIPITGLSLLAGIAVDSIVRSRFIYQIAIVSVSMWSIAAVWRTDVQIQAWKFAGNVAQSIIQQTLTLAPNPPLNSTLLFFDIPRNTEQYVYIFGIGLKEALLLKYHNRNDLTIIRYPTREDLRNAKSGRDIIFQFMWDTGRLKILKTTGESR
ncbi:MAG TPA: hypothetical protein VMZ04_06040 [Anaerolineae bacterium]|nr:hypothetical protein [Anaerolineae bacterium]